MEDILKQILSELKDLRSGQNQLEKRFDGLEKKLDKTRDDIINQLGNYVEKVVTHIDEKVDDQQRIIETLSSRSIKHESEIKDVKRLLKN